MPDQGSDSSGFARAFLNALPAERRQQISSGRLEESLEAIWSRAREAWPDIELDAERFFAFVARRLPEDAEPEEVFPSLKVGDLYLACACLDGNAKAHRAFLNHCLPVVKGALSRIDPSGTMDDEVLQGLLERLFTAAGEDEPRLAQYNGHSAIGVWVRVAAVRQALNLLRSVHRERALDENMLMVLMASDNQEMAYFKKLYQDEFKRAFHQVLSRLSGRERNLLTFQMVEGLSMEQIGQLYRVNRSTVSRWLRAVRDKVHAESRAALMERLDIGKDEFESILKLVLSRFDASLMRVLADGVDKADPPAHS
jgi:RNA polymerase sigma-70 factor (ECF subfamily)